MKGKTGNEGAKNLCPEGWTALNDAEAKDYILWVGQHLKSQVAEALYTYCWFDKDDEATNLRILGGYPYDRLSLLWYVAERSLGEHQTARSYYSGTDI